jgi:hypothetical protein
MRFRVNYQKVQEFEIKELNIDFESSEESKPDHPTTSIVKTLVISMIAVIAIASALAVYGAEHKQPKLFRLADKILQIHHSVIDIGRDWATDLHRKK